MVIVTSPSYSKLAQQRFEQNRISHVTRLSGSHLLGFRRQKLTVLADQPAKFFPAQIPVFPTRIPRVQPDCTQWEPSGSIDYLNEEFAPREHYRIPTRKEVVGGSRAFLSLDGNALDEDWF